MKTEIVLTVIGLLILVIVCGVALIKRSADNQTNGYKDYDERDYYGDR
jgi:hypothetical protein